MLTICIPAYNYARYLPEAVESCLEGGLPVQVVVLDNCSSDGTPELRSRFASDKRIKWVRNDHVLPVQANWNRAVELSDGHWIKLLQADDQLSPGSVARLLEITEASAEEDYHAHLAQVIDADGQHLRWQRPYTRSGKPMRLAPGEGLPLKLRQIARLREPTSNLYTKRAWQSVHGYPSNNRGAFDLAFNVELLGRYSGTLWSEHLGRVRRHSSSDGAKLDPAVALADLTSMIERIYQVRGADLTFLDRCAGIGWQQARVVELVGQRLKTRTNVALGFLSSQVPLLINPAGWPYSLGMLFRRLLHDDPQKVV